MHILCLWNWEKNTLLFAERSIPCSSDLSHFSFRKPDDRHGPSFWQQNRILGVTKTKVRAEMIMPEQYPIHIYKRLQMKVQGGKEENWCAQAAALTLALVSD
jgi:hypothetical protein